MNYATSLTGGGSANYPSIPSTAFSEPGIYDRTFSWGFNAAGGTS